MFRFWVCEVAWFWVCVVGSRWLRGGFLLGSQGGLRWCLGWFEVDRSGSGWILVDPVVVGGGLRVWFIANKNENNNNNNNKIINKNITPN